MIEYHVVEQRVTEGNDRFIRLVQEYIDDGWELVGGVAACVTDTNGWMAQALKRDKA